LRDSVQLLAVLIGVACHLVVVVACRCDEMMAVSVDDLLPPVPVGDVLDLLSRVIAWNVLPKSLVRVLFVQVC
jgi:hypothetical protein